MRHSCNLGWGVVPVAAAITAPQSLRVATILGIACADSPYPSDSRRCGDVIVCMAPADVSICAFDAMMFTRKIAQLQTPKTQGSIDMTFEAELMRGSL